MVAPRGLGNLSRATNHKTSLMNAPEKVWGEVEGREVSGVA